LLLVALVMLVMGKVVDVVLDLLLDVGWGWGQVQGGE
jgi:hypothetical protein